MGRGFPARARTTRNSLHPKQNWSCFARICCVQFFSFSFFFVIYRTSFRDEPDVGTACRLLEEREKRERAVLERPRGTDESGATSATVQWPVSLPFVVMVFFFFPQQASIACASRVVERVYRYILLRHSRDGDRHLALRLRL